MFENRFYKVIGKSFETVNYILNREGFVEVDQFPLEGGYEVTYYQPFCGCFIVKFDWESHWESTCRSIKHIA